MAFSIVCLVLHSGNRFSQNPDDDYVVSLYYSYKLHSNSLSVTAYFITCLDLPFHQLPLIHDTAEFTAVTRNSLRLLFLKHNEFV